MLGIGIGLPFGNAIGGAVTPSWIWSDANTWLFNQANTWTWGT